VSEARGLLDAPAEPKLTSPRRWWIAATAAGVLTGIAAGWLLWSSRPGEVPLRTFSFTPESLATTDLVRRAVISPNGRHIVYAAGNSLRIRDLDSERARRIEGTENAEGPFWSPDSGSVAFAAGQELKKVAIAGGAPLAIARLPGAYRGGAWSQDGLVILVSLVSGGLFEVPAAGGNPKQVAVAESGAFYSPNFVPSPAGERRVVASMGTRGRQTIEWIDLKTGKSETLREGAYPFYSSSGYILFQAGARRPGLWALALSPRTGRPEGEPFPILNEATQFSTSGDGTLVWTDDLARPAVLVWRDRAGKKLWAAASSQSFTRHVGLSPDGTRVAYSAEEQGNDDIWILDLERQVRTRFSFGPEPDLYPKWTPSGKEIAFSSVLAGRNMDVFLQPADGSGEPRAVIAGPLRETATGWSPDGRILLFQRLDPKTGSDLWFTRRTPDGAFEQPAPFLRTAFEERDGKFSPDGRNVAYTSGESGRSEVHIRSFPDGGGKRQISVQGGDFPRWSRDGKEVFYRNGDALFAVPVSLQGSFSAGAAVELFRNPGLFAAGEGAYPYDVAPDGKRFLIAEPDDSGKAGPAAIHVVLNWTALLRKKPPTPD
jgi:Tol biopolymer transport system component